MKSFLHLPFLYLLLVAIFTAHVNAQQIFDSNVQSAYDPSDTPEVPAAPIQSPAPISSSPTEAVEETVPEAVEETVPEAVEENVEEAVEENVEEAVEENVEEAVEENVEEAVEENVEEAAIISVVAAAQIVAGGEDSEVALNNFVQEQNYNLSNSSDIDQIVGALENELSSSPERSASVAVTLSTLVTADFIASESLSVGAINSSSIVVAVQKSMNIISQSSKFNQLITATNVVNVKQGVVSSVTKLLEDSGLSGEELAAALKQVEEIVESQLETITVDSGSTDVGSLAQVSI